MNKRIVICSDGTWNTPDQKDEGEYRPSNVVKIARAVDTFSQDEKHQIVFYDEGVGADKWGLDRLTGGAFGRGLDKNILDAYRFLIRNYVGGDEIFLFGFSRGAYTVRSTAGLIRNSGLLKKIHLDKVEEALELYRSDLHPNDEESEQFRKKYSREIEIKFIGVWDTVGALGIPVGIFRKLTKRRYEFHDVELSKIIKHAYHALAIDEQRGAFRSTLWENEQKPGQMIEQVWFAGVHGDVGGGYKDSSLSDIAFQWMREKAEYCGLTFNDEYIGEEINQNALGQLHDSRTFFFKVTPKYIRPIGKVKLNEESIHPAAVNRYDKYKPPYRPDNLTEYLNTPDHKVATVKHWP
ncbi:DUF2235 domain-containing protein [candidate division WOR-3 bacterium]|nr:DUF2235 domain-containing protein [candidate division WOR-3 bacterium]